MSSMRSASSSTTYSTWLSTAFLASMWSSSRPGVAMSTSTPAFSCSVCGFMSMPPKTTAERNFVCLAYFLTLSATWSANSRVGANTRARTGWRAGETLALKAGVEVLIATPGRLLDHIEAKNAVLNQVEYVVLDEADRMLDIGFLPDLQRILSYLPKARQTLLFSATFSPEIRRLANSYLQDPVLVEVARPNATATNVEQRFYSVTDDDKRAVVRQLLKSRELSQALIFVNSKLGAARLARSFERDGLKTQALHGDKSQDERLKALAAFKAGEVDLLVATDVAARGLDIADLPAVFNFDVPYNAEDYVHRIGRTGRAGASGLAVTLVSRDDVRLVGDIEKLIKKKIDIEAIELEDDRPPRRPPRRDDDERPERPVRAAVPRFDAPIGIDRPRRAAAPGDPFFDKPYEPTGAGGASWEAGTKPAGMPNVASRGLSPNIKPKRKVASLLGGGQ